MISCWTWRWLSKPLFPSKSRTRMRYSPLDHPTQSVYNGLRNRGMRAGTDRRFPSSSPGRPAHGRI